MVAELLIYMQEHFWDIFTGVVMFVAFLLYARFSSTSAEPEGVEEDDAESPDPSVKYYKDQGDYTIPGTPGWFILHDMDNKDRPFEDVDK